MKKTVLVASANPVKIEAVRRAVQQVFPDQEIICTGKAVSSDIPDQPVGVSQTLEGAVNRVNKLKQQDYAADFYVGIEGGIHKLEKDWYAFAWMYIESSEGVVGKAMTGFFQLPPAIVALLDKGMELGHASDAVFSKENSKQKSGAVGLLTDDLIDRTGYYVHAMILAMIPFIKRDYFSDKKTK